MDGEGTRAIQVAFGFAHEQLAGHHGNDVARRRKPGRIDEGKCAQPDACKKSAEHHSLHSPLSMGYRRRPCCAIARIVTISSDLSPHHVISQPSLATRIEYGSYYGVL